VARADPFHWTTDELMKLLPLTVKKKPSPPAAVEVGLKLVIAGTGLPVPAEVTVTTTVFELLPGTGSGVELMIEAVFESDPATVGVTMSVIVALLPLKILTRLRSPCWSRTRPHRASA